MSIKIMDRVWRISSCEGSQLLLLLALADHANDEGVCWPGIPSLARKTRITERYARMLLRKLEASGEIYVALAAGRGNTNMYLITLGLSADEIAPILTKRFGKGKNKAEYLAQTIAKRLTKGEPQFTFCQISGPEAEPEKGELPCQKGEPQCQKGNPSVEKGEPQFPRTVMNHHENHQENRHGTGATAPPPPEPKPTNPLAPDTPEARKLFARLQANARARSRRGAKRFPSLECKQKFIAAAERLDGEFDTALIRALEKGITSVTGVVDFIAKWEDRPQRRGSGRRGNATAPTAKYREQFFAGPARKPQEKKSPDQQLWDDILVALQGQMAQATFDTHLAHTTATLTDSTLTVTVRSAYNQDWLKHRLQDVITRTVTRVAGRPLQVTYTVPEPQPEEVLTC